MSLINKDVTQLGWDEDDSEGDPMKIQKKMEWQQGVLNVRLLFTKFSSTISAIFSPPNDMYDGLFPEQE